MMVMMPQKNQDTRLLSQALLSQLPSGRRKASRLLHLQSCVICTSELLFHHSQTCSLERLMGKLPPGLVLCAMASKEETDSMTQFRMLKEVQHTATDSSFIEGNALVKRIDKEVIFSPSRKWVVVIKGFGE